MFLDFYNLREQPFGVTPDHRFLYLGKNHREALASLFYGIEADRGFVALIAPPGLGKTTLTFQLLEKLQRAARTVFLFQTQCNSRELLQYLLNDLGVDTAGMDIVTMHNKLNVILSREMLAGRRFVLAIDEAQNLGAEVLETIRLLSNFETPRAKLLQILLIGQPQLARKLASPALVQLQQRVSVLARLEPFGVEETARYIAHRLQVAGYSGGPLFTPGAMGIIQDRSQGIPRNINALCFNALSIGCATGRKRIDTEIVREVVADMDVESLSKPIALPRATPAPAMTGTVLSYRRPAPRRWIRRLAVGTACAAVFIAAGAVILPSSSSKVGRFLHKITELSASIRSDVSSTKTFAGSTTESGLMVSPDEKAAGYPDPVLIQPASSSSEIATTIVIVRPGETLRQIALRTVGQFNDAIVGQIRELNPAIADSNHIEAGQEIRLPGVSARRDVSPSGNATNPAGTN
jgi:general secretion pathway protein A